MPGKFTPFNFDTPISAFLCQKTNGYECNSANQSGDVRKESKAVLPPSGQPHPRQRFLLRRIGRRRTRDPCAVHVRRHPHHSLHNGRRCAMITIDNELRYAIFQAVTELISAATTLETDEKLKILNAAELLASFAREDSTSC